MVGGVWEWCEDLYLDVSEGEQPTNGRNPTDNPVLRGSSYVNSDPMSLYVAYRHEDPRDLRHPIVGFRVAV